ncbi:MAG: hypothetical protein EP320_07570 [Rhodobacteraceae bacterium]|nr:MAG: hypothetical protein EP320_07570 [Paracoccaceae bacterium]
MVEHRQIAQRDDVALTGAGRRNSPQGDEYRSGRFAAQDEITGSACFKHLSQQSPVQRGKVVEFGELDPGHLCGAETA